MASPAPSRSSSKATGPDQWNPTVRSVVSLLVIIHFTCVFVVLSSNHMRSQLQNKLVRIFGAYTQLLDFDPNFTPYSLTVGEQTDDVVFAIDLYPDNKTSFKQQKLLKTVTLPDHGSKLLDSQKRYFNLARIVALNADPVRPDDDITGEIARAIGKRIMAENDAGRCVVRCVRRQSQPMDVSQMLPGFPSDKPTDPRYDVPVYAAEVWFYQEDENSPKEIQLQKLSATGENAPTTGGS